MRSDNVQAPNSPATMTSRQKVIAVIFILVVLIVLWQIIGLFRSSPDTAAITPAPSSTPLSANKGQAPSTMQPHTPQGQSPTPPAAQSNTPQPAQLITTQLSQQEQDILRARQETQLQYLSALNQLQMLKVQRDIAEANSAIAAAELAKIKSQKDVVNMLAPPPPPTQQDYAKSLADTGGAVNGGPGTALPAAQVNYTVISVSQLQSKWNAVIGYQGHLYHVQVGDVLPADGSAVISISRSGVVLEKDGQRKKISLVPII